MENCMSPNKPFNSDDWDDSLEEFDEGIKGLIDKGIVEEIIIDGEINYQLTNVGLQLGPHLNSSLAEQN